MGHRTPRPTRGESLPTFRSATHPKRAELAVPEVGRMVEGQRRHEASCYVARFAGEVLLVEEVDERHVQVVRAHQLDRPRSVGGAQRLWCASCSRPEPGPGQTRLLGRRVLPATHERLAVHARSAARGSLFATAGLWACGAIAMASTTPPELRDNTLDGLLVGGLEGGAVCDTATAGGCVGWVQLRRDPPHLET